MEEDHNRPLFRSSLNRDDSDVSPLIKRWMPEASRNEQIEATRNFRAYMRVLYRIYLRIEQERREKTKAGDDTETE